MINFSKKLLVFSCLLMVTFAAAKKHKTHKLQLLVFPTDSSYIFALNAGNGIDYNPGAIRPQGSYYITNAFIFPGGTVSKHQTDFSVDKDGHPIVIGNNVGQVYLMETMMQDLDFDNPPLAGTVIQMCRWNFLFNDSCGNLTNTMYTLGFNNVHMLPPQLGHAIIRGAMAVAGGTGCNAKQKDNSCEVKVYLAQTGPVAALIKVKFDKEVVYED